MTSSWRHLGRREKPAGSQRNKPSALPTGPGKPQLSYLPVYPRDDSDVGTGAQLRRMESTRGAFDTKLVDIFMAACNGSWGRNALCSHGSSVFFLSVAHPQDPHHPPERPVIHCHKCGEPCKGEVLRVQTKHFHIKCFTCKGTEPQLPAHVACHTLTCCKAIPFPFMPPQLTG